MSQIKKITWNEFLKEISFTTKNKKGKVTYIGRWGGESAELEINQSTLRDNFDDAGEILKFITNKIAKNIADKINKNRDIHINKSL